MLKACVLGLALLCLTVVTFADTLEGQKTPLWHVFHDKFDVLKRDGMVTLDEMSLFIYNMDSDGSRFPQETLVRPWFAEIDADSSGQITWAEFSQFYSDLNHGQPNDNSPVEIHLALNTNASQMVVIWLSNTNSTPTVQYGTSSSLGQSVTATSKQYSIGTAWTSMPIHTAVMTGLQPRTKYFYRVGDGQTWSALNNFTSAPGTGKNTPNLLSWVVYGDMGTTVPMGKTVTDWIVADLQKKPADIVLHVGDLAYAGVNKYGEWEPTWDVWVQQIQPMAASMPYMVTVGNHEAFYNFSAYINRFQMPGDDQGANGNFYYSFDFGNVHLLSMDTEHAYEPGSPQRQFIEADLATARANPNIVWIIVSGHRPYYSSDNDEYDSHRPGCRLLTQLEQLYVKYQVDLVVTGHMHCYERTYPVNNGTVHATPGQKVFTKPDFPIYIVQGTAGAMIEEKWVDPQPAWSAVRAADPLKSYGFGRMDVSWTSTSNTLYYVYKTGKTGTVVDELTIYK